MENDCVDNDLRRALYDRSGMNFFVCEIDGGWHAGWFRIADGRLEVSAETQRRAVEIDDPETLTGTLRSLLADIILQDAPAPLAGLRSRQGPRSASLHGRHSVCVFPGDSAKEPER